ncbi:NADH-ubiquinone oxidoreductase [Oceanicola granulosus HTCC2516]|uniref:NADH-ubiquinone oxidoreductase n=1 Tax=Oceanicola granulosus (strain ATCC BAA-861 / DSM 15982 / KCTC 12143 / HTCC2516) TaxID=314256 RepID=Q2CKB6_OCEGH|nr:complex I NDUFA9 subunit family protein [Oceanicola granulosus]EAR52873.1 NADH-ubiquinone oxidoreductase [Oceanicola granulosus HTCC2516]
MSKLVTIFGGSGFVGRYIARRLAKQGWRIRVAVRRPEEALFVRPYGNVGQVVPVFCNVRDDDSVRAVTRGADVVVNCVGVLTENGRNTFQAVQEEAPERIARIAAEEGVARMVHVSAIGADPDSPSEYARTKAAGEAGVRARFPGAVILRPSIVFGQDDEFFNRFARMAARSPVLPVVGGNTRFQPVFVDDVAKAAALAVEGKAAPGIYELGGPDVNTFSVLMREMLDVILRRRLIVNVPFGLARLMASGFTVLRFLSLGLFTPPLTRDQVENLRSDNIVADGARGFAELGIQPKSMEAILPDYLWRFRPTGQYDAIKASAKNIKRSGDRASIS